MTKSTDEGLTDEEFAREVQGVDQWTPERLAAAQSLTIALLEARMSADSEAYTAKLASTGAPLRDFIILTARSMADHAAKRQRRLTARTRTSPVDPCEDYDPRDFWKAMDVFKDSLRAMAKAVSPATLAAAAISFRGGPLPGEEVPEPERILVAAADAALAQVRSALSVPGEKINSPTGGKKCLATDQWVLEEELRKFAEFVATASER